MTTSLAARIKRLEGASGGGGECPRCSGTTVIYLNGKLDGVSKHGRRFTPEEAEAFKSEEEQDGCCPVCGARRGPGIRVGWAAPRRS
jgi:hypothetical protein